MAHALRFSFTLDGNPLRIVLLDGSSIGFAGDVDVFARDTRLDLAMPSEFDRRRFRMILNGRSVSMTPDLEDGVLIYRCTSDARLPSGRYEWRLTVDGLHAADRPHQHFDVATDGDGVVEVEAPFFSDVRRVNLRTAPKDFPDDDIRTLVFAEESRLDGKPAADWLEASDVTPQRRALVLNILAKLRCVPSPDAPLIRKVEAILGAQNDRVYMRMSPTLIDEFGSLVDGDFFRREHGRLAPIHQRLLSWVRMRVDPPEPEVPFKLTSFRQAATFTSLQVVLASIDRKKLKKNDPPPPPTGCYADLDIDVGGSLTDIVGLVAHVGELLNGSMTDHVGLHDRLAKDGNLSPFLYYTVEAGV